ncbi:MAG: DUF4349 domain-containing protein [Micrococcales bacterium]|nr:DUF4349 domain-containing protein [Micrococcales bacterium]
MRTHVLPRLVGALTVVVASAALFAGCSSDAASSGKADYGGAYEPQVAERPPDDAMAEADYEAPAQPAPGGAGHAEPQPDRQVIQTGRMTLTTDDPVATVPDVVTLVRAQGRDARVDSHNESAAHGDRGGSATLTVRVPADRLEATIDELKKMGEMTSLTLTVEDVTGTVQDLDARIGAQQVSVDRMTAVLAAAQTTADIIAAESALTARQSQLESMVAQRNRIADQVSLSTLTIYITTPEDAEEITDDDSFGAALARGWGSLTGTVRTVALALTVALPWLVVAGLVTAALVLGWRRRIRRARTRAAAAAPDLAPPAPQSGAK